MRFIIVALSLVLVPISSWAGTFMDDFEDGDWAGWEVVAPYSWSADVEERLSFVDGVLHVDAKDKPEDFVFVYILEDWRDYSFSADIRIMEIEGGA